MEPRIICLTGYSKVGKSQIQEWLESDYGYLAKDDAEIWRKAASVIYGISEEDFTTQEGKGKKNPFPNLEENNNNFLYENRKLVGDLGKYLENKHGTTFKAVSNMNNIIKEYGNDFPNMSFGSVRFDQASVYKKYGSLVIEIIRPGFNSLYDFDVYDKSLIDETIYNDGSLEDLKNKLDEVMNKYTSKKDMKI